MSIHNEPRNAVKLLFVKSFLCRKIRDKWLSPFLFTAAMCLLLHDWFMKLLDYSILVSVARNKKIIISHFPSFFPLSNPNYVLLPSYNIIRGGGKNERGALILYITMLATVTTNP